MPRPKASANTTLFSQFQVLAQEIQLASKAHTELSASMSKTQALLIRSDRLVEKLSAQTTKLLEQASLKSAPKKELKKLQSALRAFNLQYLQLQSQMQHENRAYTAVSNVLKSRHDTVKNAIGNVR